MIKKIIIIIAATIPSISLGNINEIENDNKVKIINFGEIYQNSPQGIPQMKALQERLQPEYMELQRKQNKILKEVEILQNNSSNITEEELQEIQNEINSKQEILKFKAMEFKQKEINEEERINKLFQVSLNEALVKVSKKKKYKVVMNSLAIAYADPEYKIDITEEITNKMFDDYLNQ